MSGLRLRIGVMTIAALVFGVGASFAGVVPQQKPSEERQAKLLERFGDQGIDANKDGELTREEVMAFFADFEGGGFGRAHREGFRGHGMGRGHRGMRGGGPGHPGMGRRGGSLLQRLEGLDSETAPEHFTIERFPKADVDGDGTLSDAEWTQFASEKRDQILSRVLQRFPDADTDGDGVLGAEELAALKAAQMAKQAARILGRHPEADTDADGVLSDGELEAFRASRQALHQARILDRHPEADTDGDGVLSEDEMDLLWEDRAAFRRARILDHHPEADVDRDGVLSDEEAAAIRGMGGRRGLPGPRRGK